MAFPDTVYRDTRPDGAPHEGGEALAPLLSLVQTAAATWRDRFAHDVPLTCFAVILETDHGPVTVTANGPCARMPEIANALFRSFNETEAPWQGTAKDLAARLGIDLSLPDDQWLFISPLHPAGRFSGLVIVCTAEPIPEPVVHGWQPALTNAVAVAGLFRDREVQRTEAAAFSALDNIARVLSQQTDLQTLYRVVHREVARVTACDAFYVCLYSGSGELEYVYHVDQGEEFPPEVCRLGNGPTSYCIRTGKPFVLTEENAHIQHDGIFLGEKRHSGSAIHVPMVVDGEPIGVLSAQSYQPGAYNEAHLQLLSNIATKVSIAFHNTQLLQRIRTQRSTLDDLTQALQVQQITLGRVDDIVVTCDQDGIIQSYNEAITRTLGYGPSELLGRSIVDLRTSGRGSWEAFRHARNRRISITAKDGRAVPVLYSTEPLKREGRIVGWLTIARNLTELQRSEEDGRIALELERERISRDLHDGLIQSLSIAKMQLQILQRNNVPEGIRQEMAELQETVSRGLTEARHYIVDLKHAQLSSEGLVRTARRYAHELGRVTGLAIGVSADADSSPLSDTDEVQLFYILREALNNVRKHAQARRVRVEFRQTPDEFRMSVEDDGHGFDVYALQDDETGAHWGLQHIRERARALGGAAEISSTPGGGGTRVSVVLPLGLLAARQRPYGDHALGSTCESGCRHADGKRAYQPPALTDAPKDEEVNP